jgi:Fur family iron response transcriptional regulator
MRKRSRDSSDRAVARLREAGLRPTRPRIELTALLFAEGNRHLTAEALHEEAARSGAKVSLATVYNTLHQFTQAGILREVLVDATRSYFDTNTSEHQHFFIEDEKSLIDIPGEAIAVSGVPQPPKGTELARVDVVIRVRRPRA